MQALASNTVSTATLDEGKAVLKERCWEKSQSLTAEEMMAEIAALEETPNGCFGRSLCVMFRFVLAGHEASALATQGSARVPASCTFA